MKIPLMKHAFLHEEETKKALAAFILGADRLSMDKQCLQFEQTFAKYQGRQEGILFNSGGSANLALLQALRNLGRLDAGDAVGFSALTWSTNTMPILQQGMVPVALDCEPDTMNVSSRLLEERLKEVGLKAFFATNVLGFTGDLENIKSLCEERGIIYLEDNCESLGTMVNGQKTGNFGLAATFSFFVAHHMSTIEGGMVCTDDAELAEMLRIVRANGWDRNLTPDRQQVWRSKYAIETEMQAKYTFYDLAYNMRPTEITGFLGNLQVQYLNETIAKREENYLRLERTLKANEDILPLRHDHIETLSTFAFPVICKSRDLRNQYIAKLEKAGVELRPIIAGNMQRQPFYKHYVENCYDVPGADFIHENGFYFGNYPELTEEDLVAIEGCFV